MHEPPYKSLDAPSTVAQILDEGLQLFKVCFKPLILLSLASAGLGQILVLCLFMIEVATVGTAASLTDNLTEIDSYLQNLDMFLSPQPILNADELPQISPILGILLLVCFGLAEAGLYAAVIAKIDSIRGGAPMTNSVAFVYGLKRSIPLILTWIVAVILIMLGFIALIIPGIVLMILTFFSYFSTILDRVGPFRAIRESCSLVWGNWWRTLAVLIVISIVYIIFELVAYILANVVHQVLGSATTYILPGDLSSYDILIIVLSQIVWMPLIGAVLVSMFHDLKFRQQGSDLAYQVSQIPPYR